MTAAEALAGFNRQLADKHLLGFWNAGNIAEIYEPKASYDPYIWRWQDVHDGLVKAGELLTLEQTARRFIGFHTPNSFAPPTPWRLASSWSNPAKSPRRTATPAA